METFISNSLKIRWAKRQKSWPIMTQVPGSGTPRAHTLTFPCDLSTRSCTHMSCFRSTQRYTSQVRVLVYFLSWPGPWNHLCYDQCSLTGSTKFKRRKHRSHHPAHMCQVHSIEGMHLEGWRLVWPSLKKYNPAPSQTVKYVSVFPVQKKRTNPANEKWMYKTL